MIYLVGGAPRCGKTSFAQYACREFGIPWISTDVLMSVARAYLSPDEIAERVPHVKSLGATNDEVYANNSIATIIDHYKTKQRGTVPAIKALIADTVKERYTYLLEGGHLFPELIHELLEEYGTDLIRSVVLVRSDTSGLADAFTQSTAEYDWAVAKTHNPETYAKIAEMIREFSAFFMEGAEKFKLPLVKTDGDLSQNFPTITAHLGVR